MRLAVVTPWFGEELTGGAEMLAWELTHELARSGHEVTVLTTCSRSWSESWNKNHYPTGRSYAAGVPVVRFRVDAANTGAFREINRRLLTTPRSHLFPGARVADELVEAGFLQHNIVSSSLLADLARNQFNYDRVLFVPYLYGTTLRGWKVARERSAIIPCLHDEPYAYLESVAIMMREAPLLLFNSESEYELARTLYGPSIDSRSRVIGSGIWFPGAIQDGEPIGGFEPERARYVLSLGRRRSEKNATLLDEAYRRFRALEPTADLRLVLAGEAFDVPERHGGDMIVLGPVSNTEKWRLLRHARAVMQPSTNESFSRVAMEAWSVGRPVAVHAACRPTAAAVDASGAGWKAETVGEWQQLFHRLNAADDEALNALGDAGRAFAREHSSWSRVVERLEEMLAPPQPASVPVERGVVHWLPAAGYGDAVTLTALQLNAALAQKGYQTLAASSLPDDRLGALVRLASAPPKDAVTIRYLSKAVPANGRASSTAPNGRAPASLADESGSSAIVALAEAESALHSRSSDTASKVQLLTLNVQAQRRLEEAGIRAALLPPFFDDARWNVPLDAALASSLHDDRTTLLCVAPVEPSSNLDELVDVFSYYLTFDFDARLALVGPIADEAYEAVLRDRVERVGLEHRVMITGTVSQTALAAFYRSARVFVSHRSRYATGMSLLEAMQFDVPVCATANDGSRSIMGNAGILVNDTRRRITEAALWRVLASDAGVREGVLRGQRERRATFTRERSLAVLEPLLAKAVE